MARVLKSFRKYDLLPTASLNWPSLSNSSWIIVTSLTNPYKIYPNLLYFLLKPFFFTFFFALVLDSKAIDSNQPMNALMRLNQIRPGLQYRLLSQSGPVHAPVFTMSVDLDGTIYEASGSSKKTAKLHVAVKVIGQMEEKCVVWMCN